MTSAGTSPGRGLKRGEAPVSDFEVRLWAGWMRIVLRESDVAVGDLVFQVSGKGGDELLVTWQPASDSTEAGGVGQGWAVLIDRAPWAQWLRTGSAGNEARLTTGPMHWLAPDLQVAFGDRRFTLPSEATPSLLRLAVI